MENNKKNQGKGNGNAKGKSKGPTKMQKINNKIILVSKALAMEGAGAPNTNVEFYSKIIDQTKDGKTIYSAIIKIATK